MKANVDADTCSGAGVCVQLCPEVFQLNEDGISEVKVDTVPSELEDQVKQAEQSCPTGAISIEE